MKRILVIAAMLVLLGGTMSVSHAWFINFEDGTEGAGVAGITGISFEDYNGYNPLYSDIRTGAYNATSDDLGTSYLSGSFHMYGNFAVWAGPNADAQGLIVDFTNNDGTFFTTGYSATSNFYVTAYLTDGSNVGVFGGANVNNPMDFLTVNATAGLFIDYVTLHDTGNLWIVDNMSGDASGIPDQSVPEPNTLLLLGSGLLGLVGYGRRCFK